MLDFLRLDASPPDAAILYFGTHDPVLVGLSILVAVFGAYAALLVSQHVTNCLGRAIRAAWIVVGGLCMGAAIWGMHFVGMLAFSLPCSTTYDPPITLLSVIPGILAGILAIATISRQKISTLRLIVAGTVLGAGIGAMHFTGMAAMRLAGTVRYAPLLFSMSIVVAVALAILALWFKFHLEVLPQGLRRWAPALGAVVMGTAISGMHYTAMASAYFVRDPEVLAEAPQVVPTFLAAVVLLVTCAVIVATLVAVFLTTPSMTAILPHVRVVGILVALWTATAWLLSGHYNTHMEEGAYRKAMDGVRTQVDDIIRAIEYETDVLQGLATVMARDEDVRAQLSPNPTAPVPDINRRLQQVTAHFSADVVFVLNRAGDCVASSNAGTPASFVGNNFADRDYYRQPLSGLPGRQYAVGRVSLIPGLYYSHPVLIDGEFAGVVVVKRDVPNFARWTRQADTILSDANGVIILAADHGLVFKTLPGSTASRLAANEMSARYGRDRLEPLSISPWRDSRYPDVVRLDGRDMPVAMAARSFKDGLITVHVTRQMQELASIVAERQWLFLLFAVSGAMIIVAVATIQLYLRTTQASRRALEAQALQLARSNADLEQFAYVASHDLQTPLRNIVSYTQLLERRYRGQLGADADEFITFIIDSTKQMRRLIIDLLEYSRVSNQSRPLEPVQAGDAMAQALLNLTSEIDQAAAEITVGEMPVVMAEPSHLASLFQNLLGNGIRYRSPDRRPRLSVTAERINIRQWKIAVTDNGVGIEPDYHDKIFEIFQRLDPISKAGGTGIGLTICRRIVHRFGGSIWVESAPGHGSTFFFTLDGADFKEP